MDGMEFELTIEHVALAGRVGQTDFGQVWIQRAHVAACYPHADGHTSACTAVLVGVRMLYVRYSYKDFTRWLRS